MKKLLSIILVIVMLCSTFAGLQITSRALSSKGKCGTNVTYVYDYASGKLTISGSGAMKDYEFHKNPFYGRGIKTVVIKNGVTRIGNYAFFNCKDLNSITIPNSVTSIGKWAFCCEALKSITIPNSVKSIGDEAFCCCVALKSITIPNSVTSIGKSAFNYCIGLESVTIGNSVKSIGDNAFCDCSSLINVNIPKSVTSIGDNAFCDCSSLINVNIPKSVTSIGREAFCDCSELESITLPDTVTSIGQWAFSGTAYYNTYWHWEESIDDSYDYNILYLGSALIAAKQTTSGTCNIKTGTTCIADYAFESCRNLESITIPNSVKSIGIYAFKDCSSLESVNIPKSVTSIGTHMFYNCSSLTSITIPDSVTSIGKDAFYGTAYYNNNLNWKNNILYIGHALIKAKSAISGTYTIKAGTTCIANDAFYDCIWLTSITIPNSVIRIGDCGFKYCDRLKRATIGNSVISIGKEAFSGCGGLTSVTIPKSVKNIGKGAFNGCIRLLVLKYKARTANAIKVQWNNVKTVTGYQVQISSKSGSKWSTYATLKAGVTNYTFKNLASGNNYKFRVRFYIKANGNNHYGPWSATLTSPTLPKATNVSLTATKKAFTARWGKVVGVTGYQVQYATNANFSGARLKAVKGAAKVKFDVKSLKGGAKYFVRVRTFKTIAGKNYYSAWSGAKAVKTKK